MTTPGAEPRDPGGRSGSPPGASGRRGPAALWRLGAWTLASGAAWWIISEGRPGAWAVAVPTVLAAAALAAAIVPWPKRMVRPSAAVRFAGWFLVQSVRGGQDVARRALSPSLPIAPAMVELTTRLPEGAGRVLLADVLSLLPGTFTVDVEGDRILVHALAAGPELEAEFREVEARVADLLGLPAGGSA